MKPAAMWKIEMLGRLRVVRGETEITRFRTAKTGTLLAYLGYYLRRSHPRDQLVDLFWPEEDESAGRHNLRNALSSLRQQLEPGPEWAGKVILADRFSVQLNPATVTTDVAEFEAAVRSSAQAVSDTERVLLLSEAVTLYRDELLPAAYEDWCLGERERLAGLYLGALRELMARMENAGDVDRAVDYARQALRADPLSEDLHIDLMHLLSVAGQLSAALRQYRQLETVLARELEEKPSPRAQAVVSHLERRAREEADHPRQDRAVTVTRRPSTGGSVSGSGMEEGAGRARSLYGAGLRAHGRNDASSGRTFMEESIAIFREFDDRAGLAYSLCFLGSLITETGGSYEEARRPCEEALVLFRSLHNVTGTAYALISLARIAYDHGDLDAARALLDENVAILRKTGGKSHVSRALISLGNVAGAQGDTEAARRFYGESLELARGSRPDGVAWWLEELAEDTAARSPERAARLLGASARLRAATNSPPAGSGGESPSRRLEAAEAILGADAYAAAWASGQRMSADQAIRYVLESSQDPSAR